MPLFIHKGQIYERKEIAKYLEKEGDAAISPVTREKIKNKDLVPLVHVRNTIEHLVESGIIEGELADTWKERMKEKREEENEVKKWLKKAKDGDADAMYQLALCYCHGTHGLKKDSGEVYKWAKKGADMRHVQSRALAGRYLVEGVGTEQNLSDGFSSFRVFGFSI